MHILCVRHTIKLLKINPSCSCIIFSKVKLVTLEVTVTLIKKKNSDDDNSDENDE